MGMMLNLCFRPRANHFQDATLTKFAGYDEEEILPVFNLLISYLEAPVAHEALFKKYASKKFLKGMFNRIKCRLIKAHIIQPLFCPGSGLRTTVRAARLLARLHNSLSTCLIEDTPSLESKSALTA